MDVRYVRSEDLKTYEKGSVLTMSEFANFVEYCVEKKVEGTYRLKRILLVLIAIALPIVILLMSIFITNLRFLVPPFAVILGLFVLVYMYVSRFVHIEYEYRIEQGEFQMDIVYGQRQKKKVDYVRVKKMEVIRPLDKEHEAEVDACDCVYDCCISRKHPTPDIYYCIYQDEKKGKCAMIFEATRKTMEIMKFYNSSALTIKEDLRH